MAAVIDPELLDLLRCPETRQPLIEVSPEQIDALNRQILAGEIVDRSGRSVTEPIDGALLREDRQWFYPIRSQVPVLLIAEAVRFPQPTLLAQSSAGSNWE